VKCAIAIDSGNESIAEIILTMLPDEWCPHVTVATYNGVNAVIAMVRNTLPDLLVIYTNLLFSRPEDGIAGCAAVSPGTRYLILHAWSDDDINSMLKLYEPLHVSVGVVRMPFERAQLIATLKCACGWLP